MKKIQVFLIIFIYLSNISTAQIGTLTVKNNNTNCSVDFSMVAEAPSYSDPSCDISGNGFSIPACSGTCSTYVWTDYMAFQSSPGWSHISNTLATTPAAADFFWTDVNFGFNCPGPSSGKGTAGVTASTCLTGSVFPTWSGTIGGYSVSASLTWSGSALTITFN